MESMRYLVIMSDNRPLTNSFWHADYNSLVVAANSEYCKKHNYDFLYLKPFLKDKNTVVLNNCIDPHTLAPRHAAWSKVLSLHYAVKEQLSLSTYDYIVYIDSDCIFKNFDITLDDYILPHKDYDILITNDAPQSVDTPCTGFIVCKSVQASADFLKEWYNVNSPDKNVKRCWEQDGLLKIFKNYSNLKIIDNTNYFNEQPGQYLRHITTFAHCVSPANKRVPYFRKFVSALKIDYRANINNVRVIEYETVDCMNKMNETI